MIDEAELLDASLEDAGVVPRSDLTPLVELAVEVARSLQESWLTQRERDVLFARALELAARGRARAVLRHVVSDPRLRAVAGGAAVTLAAGTAIAVALARQHRAAPVAA